MNTQSGMIVLKERNRIARELAKRYDEELIKGNLPTGPQILGWINVILYGSNRK